MTLYKVLHNPNTALLLLESIYLNVLSVMVRYSCQFDLQASNTNMIFKSQLLTTYSQFNNFEDNFDMLHFNYKQFRKYIEFNVIACVLVRCLCFLIAIVLFYDIFILLIEIPIFFSYLHVFVGINIILAFCIFIISEHNYFCIV